MSRITQAERVPFLISARSVNQERSIFLITTACLHGMMISANILNPPNNQLIPGSALFMDGWFPLFFVQLSLILLYLLFNVDPRLCAAAFLFCMPSAGSSGSAAAVGHCRAGALSQPHPQLHP